MKFYKIFLFIDYLLSASWFPYLFSDYERLENATISYYTNYAYGSDDYYTYDWLPEFDDDE